MAIARKRSEFSRHRFPVSLSFEDQYADITRIPVNYIIIRRTHDSLWVATLKIRKLSPRFCVIIRSSLFLLFPLPLRFPRRLRSSNCLCSFQYFSHSAQHLYSCCSKYSRHFRSESHFSAGLRPTKKEPVRNLSYRRLLEQLRLRKRWKVYRSRLKPRPQWGFVKSEEENHSAEW